MKHNNHIQKIGACLVSLVAPFALSAQSDDSQELQKTIQVYSEYKPKISDASRISVNPTVNDTLNLQVNLKYDIATSPLNTDYHIIPLKAVSVKGDKLQELYRGEIVAGLGNYWNNLFSVRFMTERSRLRQSGIEFYHFGSAGKVKLDNKEKTPAGFTTDYVSVYWKRFYDKFTVYASVKPQYRSVLRYGYNTTAYEYDVPTKVVVDLDKKDIRRNLLGFNANAGLTSNDADVDALRFNADVDYDLSCAMNPTNVENLLALSGGVGKNFGAVVAGLNANYTMSALNFSPKDTAMGQFQSALQVLPYAKVGAGDWSLQAGINLSPLLGGTSKFKISPDLRFAYNIAKLRMIPFVNVYGGVDMKSMKDMFAENPYMADSTMLRPTINKLGFDIGLDGRLKKLVTYNAIFTAKAFDEMYFWRANASSQPTTYSADYDKGTLMRVHGDLGLVFRKMNIGIDANYNFWQLDSLKYPYYKPIVDATLSSRFFVVNPNTDKTKLTIEPRFCFMMYQGASSGDTAKSFIIDLGLEVTYSYNSVLQIFLDANNLLGRNNQLYNDYPTQRMNFLLGLSYSFAGHKE